MKKEPIAILFVFILFWGSSVFANESVRIGVIAAKTGKSSTSNVNLFACGQMAVEELNRTGGVLGKRVELLEFDNRSTALGSRIAARKAVDAGVVAVIGAQFSSDSLAAAPVFQEAEIPMISPISTNPDLTRIGDYIFRICFLDSFQGRVMARFALEDLKMKRAVVLTNTGNKYSVGLSKFFADAYRNMGGQILWEAGYLDSAADFLPLVLEVKKLNPDVVFLPGYSWDSALIIKQSRKKGVKSIFLGGDGWSGRMFEYGGDELNGSYFVGHWHMVEDDPLHQYLIDSYEKVGNEMDFIQDSCPLTFDAVMLLADAMGRAGSFSGDKIRDALFATERFEGVTGTISFDRYGDPIKSATILKFENSKMVYVKTFNP